MKIGEVWRKHGPMGWVKVVEFCFDDDKFPGVWIRFGGSHAWDYSKTFFWPCTNYRAFCNDQKRHLRYKQE